MNNNPNAAPVPNYHPQMAQRLEIDMLPTNEMLNKLYEKASLEQLTKRLEVAKRERQALKELIAKKQAEEELRIAEYKKQISLVVRDVVMSYTSEISDSTPDKQSWLIRVITKEMYRRETAMPSSQLDYHLRVNSQIKIQNYTKNLIERKLKSNDLWKGYSKK